MDNLIYFHYVCLNKSPRKKLLMGVRDFLDFKNEVFETAANTYEAYLPITGC